MSMQDPIADMLTRIRNGLFANKKAVSMPFSKKKQAIAVLLLEEGYIKKFNLIHKDTNDYLQIELKYFKGQSVITLLKRVSKTGLRVYKTTNNLPQIYGGYGIAIISTSKGLMSDRKARSQRIGGEVICYVA